MNDPETKGRRKGELRKLAEKLRSEGRPLLAREVMTFAATTMSENSRSKLAKVRKLARREGSE